MLCSRCKQAEAQTLECLDTMLRFPCPACCTQSSAEAEEDERRKRHDGLSLSWKERCDAEFRHHDPNHPDVDQQVLRAVIEWQPQKKGIGLFGAGDCGKTRMIWALLRRLHFEGVPWKAITSCELARLYGSTFEERAEAKAEEDRLCKVPVLFIDDLGKERSGKEIDAIDERLFAVLDARYRKGLPVLWTSNFATEEEYGRKLGPRGEYTLRRLGNVSEIFEVVKGRKLKRTFSRQTRKTA